MLFRRLILIIIIVLSLSWPSLLPANDFRLVPSISLKEDYNDNIFFTKENVRSDYLTTISPGIELVNRTGRLDANLLVRLDRIEYMDNRDAAGTNQTYSGKVRYLFTPLSSISAEAGYVRNTNPTLSTATTGTVIAAVPWNHFTSSLSYESQITEKAAATASYAYGRDYFDKSGYAGGTSHDVSVGYIYDIGKYLPALKGRMNAGYSYYNSSDTRIDNVMGTVGFSWDISEIWSILVNGGARHTWSEFSVYQPQQVNPYFYEMQKVEKKTDGWGWVAKASLQYKGEYGNADLSYTRDLTPAYSMDGAAERNALTLSTQYRLTYELSLLFSAGYYTLKSDKAEFSTQVIDERTYRVNTGLRYEFSNDIAMDASYEYMRVDYPSEKTDANRNIFSIRLYMKHTFFE